MAQVILPFSDLEELVVVSKQDAIEKLTMLGFPTEETEDGQLNVEVTPNRPDALSVEGIARVLRCYMDGEPVAYQVGAANIEVKVDASVNDVRPYFGGAVVTGVKLTESALRSIMQLQEKLHETLGRKRWKVAIGIHDMDRVSPPFRYFACGREEVAFVPLERTEKMTPLEILKRHEKGMAYAHLVGERCPMIEDKTGNILSFPPIINGELTKIVPETSNIFIDTTGTSPEAVLQAVNIVASALAERGGKIERIRINGQEYEVLKEKKWPLPVKESERLLGVQLTREQVEANLKKMGFGIAGGFAYCPGYRADVMSEVDLIEDIAIAHGFNNFEPRLPAAMTVGKQKTPHMFHELLIGLGFDEAISWTLSNQNLEKKAGIAEGKAVEIENPLTQDFTTFRRYIIPNALSILADSKNERLPIRIYELGPVAEEGMEPHLCFASMHPKASFSEVKGQTLALFNSIGKEITFEEGTFGPFMQGRCAAVILDGKKLGHIGEIAPGVLDSFGLEQPVCACEIRLP